MTSTETKTETTTAPANLRATRKEAAAKKAPAKAAPAKTTAPAAEAPAKKAAAPGGPKLRWLVETDHGNGKTQTARVGDRLYEIRKDGDTYTATVTVDGGTAEVLSETTFAKGYAAVVAAHRAAVA
jgi:Tfp pilus assembly protein FimV